MKRLFTSLSTSAWRRVLVLIWRTQSWFVLGLLALMVLGGLVPAARIQVTSAIIQAGRHPQGLVNSALLFGGLPRARSHLRLPLGMAHPPPSGKRVVSPGKTFLFSPMGRSVVQ